MPRYRASWALRTCAPMMDTSTTCTARLEGGVCNVNVVAPIISSSGTVPWMAPVHVGLRWPATATLLTPSSWGEAGEHAALLVPDENGVPEPHMPSMCPLQLVREAGTRWQHTLGPISRWPVLAKLYPWERCTMAPHLGTCCVPKTVISAPCKSCDGGGRKLPAR